MDGRWLALGAVGTLAAIGIVAARRGSRGTARLSVPADLIFDVDAPTKQAAIRQGGEWIQDMGGYDGWDVVGLEEEHGRVYTSMGEDFAVQLGDWDPGPRRSIRQDR